MPQNSAPKKPKSKPGTPKLDRAARNIVRRRLEQLEELIECHRPFKPADWARFVSIVLPEVYGEPPSPAPTAAPIGSPEKLDVLAARKSEKVQLHAPGDTHAPLGRMPLIGLYCASQGYRERLAQWRRIMSSRRKKDEIVAVPLANYHEGMVRLESSPKDRDRSRADSSARALAASGCKRATYRREG